MPGNEEQFMGRDMQIRESQRECSLQKGKDLSGGGIVLQMAEMSKDDNDGWNG